MSEGCVGPAWAEVEADAMLKFPARVRFGRISEGSRSKAPSSRLRGDCFFGGASGIAKAAR